MPLLDPYVAALSLPGVGGSAGLVVLRVTQRRERDGTPATEYDVVHLDQVAVLRADFRDLIARITPVLRSVELWGQAALLVEVSAAARSQLRLLADSQPRLVPPGVPFAFVQLAVTDGRRGDLFPQFSKREALASVAVLASSGRLHVPQTKQAKALEAELAAVRTAPLKSGGTAWLEHSPEKHVLLPALAVAIHFAEASIQQEGGRLVGITGA